MKEVVYQILEEMIISNHKGDYLNAELSAKKCIEYSNYVSVEDYLEIRNMVTVFLLDKGDYYGAVSFTEETILYEEMLVDLRKELYPDSPKVFIRYAKSLSQLGQCYSYVQDYDKGKNAFLKALDLFGEDRVNYQITLSYYLHLLIEIKDLEKYEEYAELYFGDTNLKNSLKIYMSWIVQQ